LSLYDPTAVPYHVRQWVIHAPFLTYDASDCDDTDDTDHNDTDDTDNFDGDTRHE
jgi:hypothetical protein